MKTFTKFALVVAGISLGAGIALYAAGAIANHGDPIYMYYDDGFQLSSEAKVVEKPKTNVEKFSSIEIDMSAADVRLIENTEDAFAVEYKFQSQEGLCEVKNDKLTIKSQKSGFFLTFFDFSIGKDYYVNVYYPKGTNFDLITLDTSAGDIFLNDALTCKTLEIDSSAGDVTLKNVKGALTVDLSAGDVEAENCEFGKIDFDLSAGSVKLENCTIDGGSVDMSAGSFKAKELVMTSSLDMDMSAGSVTIEFVPGQEIGYDFDLSAGSATINGEKRGDEYTEKKGYDVILTVDASAGSVDITNK